MQPDRSPIESERLRWEVVHLHPDAPVKPAWGTPCNGCGICCLTEPCPVGMLVSRRRRGACDALRWDPAQMRYQCGMVSQPEQVLGRRWRWFAPWVARLSLRWIAAGAGCDARLDVHRRPANGETPPA